MIMDKEWSEEHDTTEATNISGGDQSNYANLHANGTGPYVVKERQPDVRTVLVPNPDWWGDNKSNVTEAIFRSEEHTSELQSLMRISYAVSCLKKKKRQQRDGQQNHVETQKY